MGERRPADDRAELDLDEPNAWLRLPEGYVLARRYEIRRRIGEGWNGAVYAAYDVEGNREAAVKVLRPGLLADRMAEERFARRMHIAARLDHPAINHVFQAGKEGQLHFVVRELLNGTSLRERIDAASADATHPSLGEVARLGAELCDALQYAHRTTVHGSIKPENIIFCDDGAVKLTDFGLAGLADIDDPTSAGVPPGAAGYLAPEQLRCSKDIDHRADQYAVAAVLYEMLVGEAPVGRVRPAIEKRPEVPQPVSEALDRALESDPADRFADMAAFAAALSGPSASRAWRTVFWVAPVVILLLVVAGATFPIWRDRLDTLVKSVRHDPQAQAAAELARTQALASAANWRTVAKALPDDQWANDIAQAANALANGGSHLEAMDYPEAEKSFRLASELYESRVAAATQMMSDEPLRIAQAVRDLYDQLDALEQGLYSRLAESTKQLDGMAKDLGSAQTEEQRRGIETRRQAVENEVNLLNRLKSSAWARIFDPSRRTEITDRLQRADRQLGAGDYRGALATFGETKTRLEESLAWPEQAEEALRRQAGMSRRIEQVRSALGPEASNVPGVPSALEGADDQMAQADEALTAGQLTESQAHVEAAGEYLSDARVQAVAGLLARAQAWAAEGWNSAAMMTLNELRALDPDHSAAEALRREILAHRVTNSVGMELVFIPPGQFLMGSPSDEVGRDDDEGQHLADIGAGFYLASTEVTQGQWTAVMADNPARWKGDDLPVEQVTWDEALEFCRRLGDREGRTYRLPTEAEWEYACRAGTKTPFSFGQTVSTDQANFDGEYAYGDTPKGVFRGQTLPVAGFAPNPWGLYDMHGNVWEWCHDVLAGGPRGQERRGRTPMEIRILRGGSWRNRPAFCRCANRVTGPPGTRLSNVGFRVLLESD